MSNTALHDTPPLVLSLSKHGETHLPFDRLRANGREVYQTSEASGATSTLTAMFCACDPSTTPSTGAISA